MIQTQNLGLKIGKKTLLHPLSLQLEKGKLHLILGPNGAGKSTLIKLLSGQQKPSSGAVFYNDKNLDSYKVEELARFRAVLSQNVHFAFPLTVKEVVMMGRYPHFKSQPRKLDQEIIEEAIATFSLVHLIERDYTTLSGGEQQRVQFARIMAQIWPEEGGEKLLFLDEPLTYLDIKYQYDFLQKIGRYIHQYNFTVVGVIHDLNLAARFAENLILLQSGNLIAQGSLEKVLTAENIEQLYGMKPQFYKNGKGILIDF